MPKVFDLGAVRPIDRRMLKFRVNNLTGQAITIYGFAGSCRREGCFGAIDRFPMKIGPRRYRDLTISYEYKHHGQQTQGGPFRLDAEISTSMGTYELALSGALGGEASTGG